MFKALDYKAANEQFGFLLETMDWFPTHGGLAIGLDRYIDASCREDNIPGSHCLSAQNNKASRSNDTSSANVSEKQLDEG